MSAGAHVDEPQHPVPVGAAGGEEHRPHPVPVALREKQGRGVTAFSAVLPQVREGC